MTNWPNYRIIEKPNIKSLCYLEFFDTFCSYVEKLWDKNTERIPESRAE